MILLYAAGKLKLLIDFHGFPFASAPTFLCFRPTKTIKLPWKVWNWIRRAPGSLIANLSFKWLWHSTRGYCNYKPSRSLRWTGSGSCSSGFTFQGEYLRRTFEIALEWTPKAILEENWVTSYNISIDVRIFRSDNISDRPFHPLWLWWDYFSLNRTLQNVFIVCTLPLKLCWDSKADFRC